MIKNVQSTQTTRVSEAWVTSQSVIPLTVKAGHRLRGGVAGHSRQPAPLSLEDGLSPSRRQTLRHLGVVPRASVPAIEARRPQRSDMRAWSDASSAARVYNCDCSSLRSAGPARPERGNLFMTLGR